MSSLIIIGMLGIITMTCCGTAIFTKAMCRVQVAGAGGILSAAGLAYMLVYLIRKGLYGSYLTAAICASIIFSEFVFWILFCTAKEMVENSEELNYISPDMLYIKNSEIALIEALHNNYIQKYERKAEVELLERQLNEEKIKWIVWGSIKAEQEGASLNTFSTGLCLNQIKEKILGQQFEIEDRVDSILWMTGAFMRIEDILCRRRAVSLYQQYFEGPQKSSFDREKRVFKKKTTAAWEIGNISFLARGMAEADYLTREEAWAFIGKAHRCAVEYGFQSWHEFTESYLQGAVNHRGAHDESIAFQTRLAESSKNV